jgi:PAS domain S-box-containing protein
MSEWLKSQMDFLYVGYGLAFFFLAIAAWSLRRQRAGTPKWIWLVAFGIIHGANLWLEGLMYGWYWPSGGTLRLLLRLISFVCLLEFGRASLAASLRRFPGPWLHLPLLGIVLLCANDGVPTLQAMVRYAVGLPAGLLGMWALLRHAATCEPLERRQLQVASLLFGSYALLAGAITAVAPWPPASFLNEDELRHLTLLPAQIWRGGVILCVAVLLWWHYRRGQERLAGRAGSLFWWHYLRWGFPFVGLLLGLGWMVTESAGRYEEKRLCSDALWRVSMTAATLDPDHVGRLTGMREDLTPSDYQVIKTQLMELRRADAHARFYYLASLNRSNEVVYLADSEPATSRYISLPGDVCREGGETVRKVLQSGQPSLEGPTPSEWGAWVTALAPVKGAQGQARAVVGADIGASDWARLVARRRMWPILAVMLLMMLMIGAFIVVQRLQLLTDWLAESEERHRSLFENSGVVMALLDAETLRVEAANPAAAEFYGYPLEKMIGMEATLFSKRSQAELTAIIRAAEQAPKRVRGPQRLADGSERMVEVCVSPLLVRNRRMVFIIVMDVSEQVRAERALQDNEAQLHKIYDSMTELMLLGEVVRDAAGQMTNVVLMDGNASFLRVFGLKHDEVVGRLATQVFGEIPAFLMPCAAVVASGQPQHFECFHAPSGLQLDVSLFSPESNRFALFATDITARKYDEEQLRLQGAALAAAANGIVITDRTGRIIWANPAFTVMTGYELREVQGQTLACLRSGQHPPEFYAELDTSFRVGRVWSGEIVNRRKDNRLYTDATTITPVRNSAGEVTHFVEIKQDVTEQRSLQQQFLQAQKMESIGRLAAGIAHDFNNQLQGILGFSDLLRRALPEGDQRRADVEEVRKAAYAAADLTRQLMAFGRRQALSMQVMDVAAVIKNNQKMYQRLLGEDVGCELNLATDLERIKADPGQIDQVLMNLLVNARDAMPQGGRVSISAFNIKLDACDVGQWKDVRPGRFVVLAVSDTGAGIPADVLPHIFEPFFTTKEKHRGTGLGLATVYGITRQHGGWVHVYSQVGEGTTFKLYFPALVSAEEPSAVSIPPPSEVESKGKGQRILLVEDEDGVRALALRILTENNYQVTAAATVGEALKLYAAAEAPFEMVLSDVVLPDGNGLELVEQLLEKQPGLRVLMASGYTDERSRWPTIQARGLRFIPKPYPVAMLLRTVHEVIMAPAQPPAAGG